MQTKSAAFMQALQKSGVAWQFGLDILAADEITPLEKPLLFDQNATDRLLTAGYVTLDTTAATMRAMQVSLRNTDGRYTVGPAGAPSGGAGSALANGLIWYTARYRPWIALRTGFDALGNPIYDTTYLGIFVLTSPKNQVKTIGTQLQLNLLDKSALLQKPYLITNTTLPTYTSGGVTVGGYAAGTTFDAAMRDLSIKGGVPAGRCLFTPSALTLPADYPIAEGSTWWGHLTILAASMSQVIYFDALGNLIRRNDPRTHNETSTFTYAPGAAAIVAELDRTTDLSLTYNHTITLGGASTTATFRGEAQITDPNNPYHKNFIGDRIVYVGPGGKLDDMTPDPNLGSNAQATIAAGVYLAQHVGQQEAVMIKSRNVPAFDAYDRFTVAQISGLNTDFLVNRIQWNLDNTGMTLNSIRWFSVGS